MIRLELSVIPPSVNTLRDIDNYNKAILDSMTKIIYEDDSQIEELNVKKLVGCGFDKVEIEVEELENE